MHNSDLADQIENAVENALVTSDFSKLNKSITTAVNTSIAQINTSQHRFYQHYENEEVTMEQLEHVEGEVVSGDARADYTARRRAARAEEERARYNSRQAQEARRQAAEARRREEAARRQQERSRYQNTQGGASQHRTFQSYSQRRTDSGPRTQHSVQPQQRRNAADIVPISRNPAGRVSGTLLTVFGAIGLIGGFLMAILFGMIEGIGFMPFYVYDSLMSFFSMSILVGGVMLAVGTRKRRRIRRFYQYVRQLRGRTYCSIRELSSHIGRSRRFVLRDLRKMISLGMFPEGHIDDQQTCVILNGATYDQYLKAQNSYLARQMEQRLAAGRIRGDRPDTDFSAESGFFGTDAGSGNASFHTAPGTGSSFSTSGGAASGSAAEGRQASSDSAAAGDSGNRRSSLPPRVLQVLSAGDNYLTQIREANVAIPGEIISKKLDHLEEIIRKIYARIEEQPEQVDDLDKFINYYLPTTLKLVNAYRSFDAQSVQGDNILSAKKEIESTLDTINYAFETLLDSMYEDDALDISTDISVLQTMFAQEGLTKGAFDKARPE